MGKQTILPFGPQHPVLPEPVHFDLVLEDEKVVDAIPQIGFVHRGLEGLVKVRDFMQYTYVVERVCGICSFGHTMGYSELIENLMEVEIPERAEFLRAILHELSRIHSHLLWAGLAADAFGFESLFMHSWRLRERVLGFFEQTTGGRVIFSFCQPGGVKQDVSNEELRELVNILDLMRIEVIELANTFLKDDSVRSRTKGIGYIDKNSALDAGLVGPFGRASGIEDDIRLLGHGAYGKLGDFKPVISDGCDCYARMEVRLLEVLQSMDIIKELVSKIPAGEVLVPIKGKPQAGAIAFNRLEQPRGESYYFAESNGSKNLERFRLRTPTAMNIPGMVLAVKGCQLSDVSMIILTIDPCISCTER